MANIKALKKLAYDEDNDTAAIGSWKQNAIGKEVPDGTGGHIAITPPVGAKTVPAKGVYTGELIRNAQKDPRGSSQALSLVNWAFPKEKVDKDDSDIKNPDLAGIRKEQAEQAAKTYFGGLEGVRDYLIERGEANQRNFIKNKTVPFSNVDLGRLRQLLKGNFNKLTPKMLQVLPAIQNSMASASKAPRKGIAV